MRADQWLMLGVGALGVYAVYRLVTAPKDPRSVDDQTPILRDPPPQVILGPTIQLRQGIWYKGRVESVPTATRDDLLRMIQGLGFVDVSVYMTLDEAGDEITLPAATYKPMSGTHWFQGRWAGKTGSIQRPAALVMIWPTVVPVKRPRTAGAGSFAVGMRG